MAQFNIKEVLVRAALDYTGPHFPEWWKMNKKKYGLPDLSAINSNQLLGAKYFMQLKLSYKGQIFVLPNEPLVSIGLTKTIVKTVTVGKYKKGTVKEYINTDDYVISIKGVCVDKDDPEIYPSDQVKSLNELVNINDALEIEENAFFELFGIRRLVIEDIQFDEMIGESGIQKYSIKAISDTDFFADLNEKKSTTPN
ncbi:MULTISPECIES: DUF6046 domain-containing protein [Flavobacterium]|uniref:DUF6046 domain-containing protein n=2 Tax=Flavobacterium TaxID=237 RepID=A0A6V6YY79_9FLAO|nr:MULTISPECIES: DUF6046 domain-containing protein [Flavobacterium]CAD0004450.1 hypothetical protein FLACHUCJ7_01867 [Flavobacterium chungangense]CAD0007560.1 hypothetical protein FLAT13_03895 [Flavobacterium salmonis]